MGLADLPVEPPPLRKGPTCSVSALLVRLDAADATWLQARLDDPEWKTAAIWRVLRDHGIPAPDPQTIARHRNGECKCSR